MKASELRIGNLVAKFDGTVLEVDSIDRNGFFASLPKNIVFDNVPILQKDIVNSMLPIPLTEEWLLKFGFEKTENFWINKEPLLRYAISSLGLICSIGDNDMGFVYNSILYVHQLQNLYFELTGKELECKP